MRGAINKCILSIGRGDCENGSGSGFDEESASASENDVPWNL